MNSSAGRERPISSASFGHLACFRLHEPLCDTRTIAIGKRGCGCDSESYQLHELASADGNSRYCCDGTAARKCESIGSIPKKG